MLIAFCFVSHAQDEGPTFTSNGTYLGESLPLKSMPLIKPKDKTLDNGKLKEIKNNKRFPLKINDNALPLNGNRNAQRTGGNIQTRALEENFDGASSAESGATPPDPSGAVGPNHYVHAYNLGLKIFDKTGTLLFGPVALNTFWPGTSSDGDPIIMYDQLADRWFVSQFQQSNNALLIAISTTADPTGTYNTWTYPLDSFPDYPHYSVWHDSYLLTANKGGVNNIFALDRTALLAGDVNAQIVGFTAPGISNNPNTVFAPMSSNLLGTSFDPNTPGYIVYLQDDGWGGGITQDHLKIWEVDLDWTNIANSTISQPLELNTDPFDSFFAPFGSGDVDQPGTTQRLDMISGVVSYMVHYRPFGTHNSMIVTFNDNLGGAGNGVSGVRWFELRNDATNDWSIFQEGTYAPTDAANPDMSRFMGSAAIDAQGNIGLAYNVSGPNTFPGIRYTGRFNGDPAGQMTVAETTIIDGSAAQTFSNRFGDYSQLTMDPDNFTFWHTAEYIESLNDWHTRIASFTLSSGFDNDIGISDITTPVDGVLTATETVEVTIRNFGNLPQTGFDIELTLDGVLVATETFTGTIAANSTSQFTFVQTVDMSTPGQTYTLAAKTLLAGDQQTINDEFSKDITNVFSNDLGVIDITAPTSGEGLGAAEVVTVTIENFGAVDQSNFDVSYSIDGATPVVETVAGPVLAGDILSYSFTTTGDFSAIASYEITAATLSAGDQDPSNDAFTTTVVNLSCQTNDSTDTPIVIDSVGTPTITSVITVTDDFQVNDVNVTINIDHTWASDLDIKLIAPDGVTEVILVEDAGGSGDNFTDTVFDDAATEQIANGAPPFTGVFQPQGSLADFNGLQTVGDWTLSIFDDANQDGGSLNSWSLQICGDLNLSVEENPFAADLIVIHQGNSQYLIKLPTSAITDNLSMSVTNTLGQNIMTQDLEYQGNGYEYSLDMSNVASGMYLVRLGNNQGGSTKRIIVE